jgi:transketolase
MAEKWKAFGWETVEADGHDFENIRLAFNSAEKADKPCMIIFTTVKGKGVSFMEDELKWHYFIVNDDRLKRAKRELSNA